MKILLLSPNPFYQERGTPIAVHLLLDALARRGNRMDVVTYHEGFDRYYPNTRLFRIRAPRWVRNIAPGFSVKKLICDVLMLIAVLRRVRRDRYDLIHAVEESAFMALAARALFGVPYVFDMDSSMPLQIVEKRPGARRLLPFLRWAEGVAIRRALAVVPVCDALAEIGRRQGARRIFLLRDISLLPSNVESETVTAISPNHRFCFMYIGNLERYQGIDLLLAGFAELMRAPIAACLTIVGGVPEHIRHYQAEAERLGIGEHVRFTGPKPLDEMAALFRQADALVSPRAQGNNTPMKIYSYLDSGKPILATDLPTHTQALNREVAALCAPTPAAFAATMRRLIEQPAWGRQLADNARALAAARYSPAAFDRAVGELYGWLEGQVID